MYSLVYAAYTHFFSDLYGMYECINYVSIIWIVDRYIALIFLTKKIFSPFGILCTISYYRSDEGHYIEFLDSISSSF